MFTYNQTIRGKISLKRQEIERPIQRLPLLAKALDSICSPDKVHFFQLALPKKRCPFTSRLNLFLFKFQIKLSALFQRFFI